ncbi:hypothetical protein ACFL4Q_02515 [candidate division KSB1 bacterium]
METAALYPLSEQRIENDTGINVLVDLSHQALFYTMWDLPRALRRMGFRVCGSQASLSTVLETGKPSRIRIQVDDRRPFAWWPNADYNVVITSQTNPRYQQYMPEEREALKKFVEAGGGLVMLGGNVLNKDRIEQWPLNSLASEFNASFSEEPDSAMGVKVPSLLTDNGWQVMTSGENGKPVIASRTFGKGRIVLVSSLEMIRWNNSTEGDLRSGKQDVIERLVRMAAEGKPPVGGTLRLPSEASGGGPIYPEMEQHVGNVVMYYSKNQHKNLLETITGDMPKAKKMVEQWLPSKPPDEKLFLILSSGGGGGWAVNTYEPKEVGIISIDRLGVLAVFAHELAHTMGGPPNDKGQIAGKAPHGNRGEAHAGWFQTKIIAAFNGDLRDRDPNLLFDFDENGSALDLAANPAENREKWGKGKDWTKTWWVWQKLDERYGTTWYPRWRWVQHTRWQDEPDRELTWDEVVEDMSIAVGEDLFPFFRKIGTTLTRERLQYAEFMGETIELLPASIEINKTGPPLIDKIRDYKNPITVK